MSFLNFLKKDTAVKQAELPPMPSMPTFPDTGMKHDLPAMPAVPDMPADVVVQDPAPPIVSAPEEMMGAPPVAEPVMTEPTETMPEVALPEKPADEEFVPEKIPPLEDLPPPPRVEPIQEITQETYEKVKTEAPVKIKGPMFVKIDSFKAIIEDIEEIKVKFKDEASVFGTVLDIKNSQDQKFEGLKAILEDMQRKLMFIDKTLYDNAF